MIFYSFDAIYNIFAYDDKTLILLNNCLTTTMTNIMIKYNYFEAFVFIFLLSGNFHSAKNDFIYMLQVSFSGNSDI